MPDSKTPKAAAPKVLNRYSAIIEKIFANHYAKKGDAFEFTRGEFEGVASELGIQLPKNVGDLIYSFRYRNELPASILETAKNGLEWIIEGKGKFVRGGSKQAEELQRATRYLRIIQDLERAGKVIIESDRVVDEKQAEMIRLIPDADFDDAHIMALLIVSECKILCSLDSRSFKYLKRKQYYRNRQRPSIYTRKSHRSLLCEKNVCARHRN